MYKLKKGDTVKIFGYDPRLFLWSLLVMSTIPSCGVCKHATKTERTDSVIIRDRIIHDTTIVEIPREVEKIITRDTTSHLENKYAVSDASVSNGFLSHSLESIPQIIKVPYAVEVHDTTIVEKEAQTVIKEVKVEKPLKWHQKAKIGAFWWLLAGMLIGFRKEILKLIKIIISI